jgi:carbon monoxide dehydrogenase subunit G
MKLNGNVTVAATQEQVWQALIDPVQFCGVVPGCEQARKIDETHYEAVVSVKVQFMTVRSNAKGTLLEIDAPRHMAGELVGEPMSMAGAFRARVIIDLVPEGNGTNVRYSMDITMLGRLASLGAAMLRSTTQQLSRQFAENIANLFSSQS